MKAFLLAAGRGTRLGPLGRQTPKCLLPVGGKPLLGRWFDLLAEHGVTRVLTNTHHLAEQVRDYLADVGAPVEVELAHEEELLGSAGTLRRNRGFVAGEETFLVIYADNASTVDLGALVAAHRPGATATLGLFRVPDPECRGVIELDPDGAVVSFEEKPEQPKSDLAWAGILVGTPALLDAIPEEVPCDLGYDVLPRLVGQMRAIEVTGYHRDVGTSESYEQARADLAGLEEGT